MNIGQRLIILRKSKQLSQEEVADKLNVTRQTISKWETEQSMPDFDKIAPLCELYGISADELLTGKKEEAVESNTKRVDTEYLKEKRAKGISIGILLYFVAVFWIMISVPVLMMNPVVASSIFLLICGVATYLIIYTCMVYKVKEKERLEKEEKTTKLIKQINNILSIFTLIIYFLVSFLTMAWHITWIIWIIYALVTEIVKLIFQLRGEDDEK